MKKVKLIFPMLFIVALAASAFTQSSSSSAKKFYTTAYYQDDFYQTCNSYMIPDGWCFTDPVGYVCQYDIPAYGYLPMYVNNGFGQICYQPYYSYTQYVPFIPDGANQ